MHSEEEKMYDENEYFSSDTERCERKKEELDVMAVRDTFSDIIENFSHLEPMLSSISFSDICYRSNFPYSKNSEKHFNKRTVYELSCVLDCVVQNYLSKYDDVDGVFSNINQNKIYSKIVGSFNKYYVLN